MTSSKLLALLGSLALVVIISVAGCGGGGGGDGGETQGDGGGAITEPNAMAVSVNGALCSEGSYLNKPCVSVTICNPGGTACRTVNDILLDTGSYGLRVFKQTIPGLTLTQAVSGTDPLAECVNFADGSALWGPVQIADLRLGNQLVSQIPIQVVDASFGSRPGACAGADATPAEAGFNGILGIGVLPEDCGPACAGPEPVGNYFRCSGTGCSGTTVPVENQVQNPAARLPVDNNGVVIRLPAVPLGGRPSLNGTLVFGIGTQSNNTPAATTVLRTDDRGNIRTTYKNVFTTAFVDTGSNGIFFPNVSPTVPVCSAPNSDWYCPPQTTTLTAALMDASRERSQIESFEIGNLVRLASAENRVLREAGGPANFIFGVFDWGLPFFMGRNVYFGISGKDSPLGTGPYIAY